MSDPEPRAPEPADDGESAPDITELVQELLDDQRRPSAADRMVPVVYEELRRLAAKRLQRTAGDAEPLQPTEVVHEAYLRLADQSRLAAASRTHFFAVSAQVMRNVLVDGARRRTAAKRGGGAAAIPLQGDEAEATPPVDVLALDHALRRLAELDARQARIVELRFFGGLTAEETAEVLGLSRRTVQGDWKMARTWLRRELGD